MLLGAKQEEERDRGREGWRDGVGVRGGGKQPMYMVKSIEASSIQISNKGQ
jgi:hypothetical protein